MKKYQLLLLDANVVIYLFEEGVWDKLLEKCDVHLERTIVQQSAWYDDHNGNRHNIDLSGYENSGAITVFEVDLDEVEVLTSMLTPSISEVLHIGETESLARMVTSTDKYQICSSDPAVYRALGALNMSEQSVSLEILLKGIGLSRQLVWPFSEDFRKKYLEYGFSSGFLGL